MNVNNVKFLASVKSHMREREREKQGHRGEREGGRGDRKRERESSQGVVEHRTERNDICRDNQSRLPGKDELIRVLKGG